MGDHIFQSMEYVIEGGSRWREEKCKRTGGGWKGKALDRGTRNPEKKPDRNIYLFLLPFSLSLSLLLSRYLARISRVFLSFPNFLSDGFGSIGMHEPRTIDLDQIVCARPLKLFERKGDFAWRKLSLVSVRDASRIEKKLLRSVNRIGAKFLQYFSCVYPRGYIRRSKLFGRIDVEDRFLLLSRDLHDDDRSQRKMIFFSDVRGDKIVRTTEASLTMM